AGGSLDNLAGTGSRADGVTCRFEARLEGEVGPLRLGRGLAEHRRPRHASAVAPVRRAHVETHEVARPQRAICRPWRWEPRPVSNGDDGAQPHRPALDDLARIERGRIALGHAPLERLDDHIQCLLGEAKGPIEALDLSRALAPPRLREMPGGGHNLEPGEASAEILPCRRAEAALVETNRP